ncbi:MAG: hypothetical protein WAT71_15515 [Ignavibacteria bacterium]
MKKVVTEEVSLVDSLNSNGKIKSDNHKKSLHSSNLIKVISTFSKKELSEFEKFVSSPYFNNQSTLVRLFNELKNYYPEFNSVEFTKENLFSKINPDKKYSDTLFRKYLSNLTKLSEDYLVCVDIKSNNDRRQTSLLDQYEKRILYPMFEKLSTQIDEKIDIEEITNESFYYKNFREDLKGSFNIRTNNLQSLNKNLKNAHKYILLHLLLSSTVYSNMMLVNKKSFKDADIENTFESFFETFDLIKYLESRNNLSKSEALFVDLCKYDILLMKDPYVKDNLTSMNEVLIKMASYLNKNLLYTFFSHLNIYYLINIAEGKKEYLRNLFENYKLMISKELYISEGRGYINFSEYRSILLYALKLKEYDWAEDYINKHKTYHNPETQKNISNYSFAYLNFEKGNFDEALNYLSRVKRDNIIIKLDSEVIYMILYFEKGYFDSALSLAETTSHSLSTNKVLSKNVLLNQLKFIKYFKALIKIDNGKSDICLIEILYNKIYSEPQFRRKDWLLSKLELLIKKKSKTSNKEFAK